MAVRGEHRHTEILIDDIDSLATASLSRQYHFSHSMQSGVKGTMQVQHILNCSEHDNCAAFVAPYTLAALFSNDHITCVGLKTLLQDGQQGLVTRVGMTVISMSTNNLDIAPSPLLTSLRLIAIYLYVRVFSDKFHMQTSIS